MRIFITGATGVIGVRVVPSLMALGHEITAVARTREKREALARLGVHPTEVDLFDPEAVRRAIAGHEVIYNLATAVPAGMRAFVPGAWREMDRVRREISANLVGGALAGDSVRVLIQESFAPIYADAGDRWIDESAPVRAARYNRSVVDAEAQAARFTREGRVGIALRFGLFYGAGDALTLQLVDSIRRGWFPLFGQPDGYWSWIAHDDAAAAVIAALGVPAGTYNAVEAEPLRRRELADGIAHLLGVRAPRFLPSWTWRLAGSMGETLARSLRVSSEKLRRISGWTPRYPTMLAGLGALFPAGRAPMARS